MTKASVPVLGQQLWPGTRRYRFTLATGETWTGHVLWIDEATATDPLELVLEDKASGSVKVLTEVDTYWRLGTSRGQGGDIVQSIEYIPPPGSGRRKRTGLESMLKLR